MTISIVSIGKYATGPVATASESGDTRTTKLGTVIYLERHGLVELVTVPTYAAYLCLSGMPPWTVMITTPSLKGRHHDYQGMHFRDATVRERCPQFGWLV